MYGSRSFGRRVSTFGGKSEAGKTHFRAVVPVGGGEGGLLEGHFVAGLTELPSEIPSPSTHKHVKANHRHTKLM